MQTQGDIVVGLDIGTTKICAVVGEISGHDINIIGIGTHPSIGLRKGVVVNIESTVESIKKAVEEAELMAGCEISSVYAGIAGGHITGFNSRGIIAVKGSEISDNDVDRVIARVNPRITTSSLKFSYSHRYSEMCPNTTLLETVSLPIGGPVCHPFQNLARDLSQGAKLVLPRRGNWRSGLASRFVPARGQPTERARGPTTAVLEPSQRITRG